VVFDPQIFLEIADDIVGDRKYHVEGWLRTAIGRAYYAAFLIVEKKLRETGCRFEDTDKIHQYVIQKAMERNSYLANRLDTVRGYRVKADYIMEERITVDLARCSTRLSREIVNMVHEKKLEPC